MENKISKARFFVIAFIRISLIVAILGSLLEERLLVLALSTVALIATFVPKFFEKQLGIKIPAAFEIIVLLFIYGILFLGEVRGFFSEFWWWDALLNTGGAIALGFVGLTVLYVLYRDDKIDANPLIIAIFSFCFAVAIGSVWEIFEYILDALFGFNLQKSAVDTMNDLLFNAIGAFIVSALGYFYIISSEKSGNISGFVTRIVDKNPGIFRSNKKSDKESELKELIEKGESENLEFKSTLRTNVHTKSIDKNIELSALKTLVAFLNSNGGTLLIGVSNSGEVKGIEEDNFPNDDKLSLHLKNIIKQHIGGEFSNLIRHSIIKVSDGKVLKVKCSPSKKRVFLKVGQEEEFYVRNGPSSSKLHGNALLDYVRHRFDD